MSEAEEDFQQRRRRLYEEVREEKERQAEASRRQRQELDRLQRHLEDSHQVAVETLRREYEKARDEQDSRHEVREVTGRSHGGHRKKAGWGGHKEVTGSRQRRGYRDRAERDSQRCDMFVRSQ